MLNPNTPGFVLSSPIPACDLIPLSSTPHVEGHSTFYVESQIYHKSNPAFKNGLHSSPTRTSPHPESPKRSSPQTLKGEMVSECWKQREKELLCREAEMEEKLNSKKCAVHEFCTQQYTVQTGE